MQSKPEEHGQGGKLAGAARGVVGILVTCRSVLRLVQPKRSRSWVAAHRLLALVVDAGVTVLVTHVLDAEQQAKAEIVSLFANRGR